MKNKIKFQETEMHITQLSFHAFPFVLNLKRQNKHVPTDRPLPAKLHDCFCFLCQENEENSGGHLEKVSLGRYVRARECGNESTLTIHYESKAKYGTLPYTVWTNQESGDIPTSEVTYAGPVSDKLPRVLFPRIHAAP